MNIIFSERNILEPDISDDFWKKSYKILNWALFAETVRVLKCGTLDRGFGSHLCLQIYVCNAECSIRGESEGHPGDEANKQGLQNKCTSEPTKRTMSSKICKPLQIVVDFWFQKIDWHILFSSLFYSSFDLLWIVLEKMVKKTFMEFEYLRYKWSKKHICKTLH